MNTTATCEKREKLSTVQQKVIDKMKPGIRYSAYDLSVGLNTMWALQRKRYVDYKLPLGSRFFPRSSIEFWLCDGIKER